MALYERAENLKDPLLRSCAIQLVCEQSGMNLLPESDTPKPVVLTVYAINNLGYNQQIVIKNQTQLGKYVRNLVEPLGQTQHGRYLVNVYESSASPRQVNQFSAHFARERFREQRERGFFLAFC